MRLTTGTAQLHAQLLREYSHNAVRAVPPSPPPPSSRCRPGPTAATATIATPRAAPPPRTSPRAGRRRHRTPSAQWRRRRPPPPRRRRSAAATARCPLGGAVGAPPVRVVGEALPPRTSPRAGRRRHLAPSAAPRASERFFLLPRSVGWWWRVLWDLLAPSAALRASGRGYFCCLDRWGGGGVFCGTSFFYPKLTSDDVRPPNFT